MEQLHNKLYVPLICGVLILATVIAFAPLVHNEFTNYDDNVYITENEHVNSGLSGNSIKWALTTAHIANWHPLTWISHMVDCELFGLNATYHHLVSLLFHIANSLLLFLIFKMMTGSVWPSAFVGAAFALHPLHVESVAWAAERKDVLSTFFWLLTMWAYVRYTERKGIGRFLLALLFFGLGLMSKAMLVTLPFVLLLLDYWPLDRFRDIKKLVLEKVPFFLVMVLSSVATFFAQRGSGAIESFGTLTLKVRVANAAISYIRYIGKTFWPSRLSVFYPHLRYHLPIWQAAVSALLLVGITICVVLMLRRKRWLTVGWLWYVGTLVPVIGLVQIGAQSIADRYMYVPIIGLFVIVGWSVPDIITKRRYGRIGLGLLTGIVFLVLILCTHSQVKHWKNSHALFTHALAVTDNNIIAHQQLGGIYSKQKKYEEAIVHYEAALEILPNYPKAHNNLAIALTKLGRLDEAIMHYRKLLEHHKDNAVIHNTVASLLTQRGQFDEAIKHFKEAVRLDPQKLSYRMNLETARMRQRKVKQR